eukprot:TRINITY_DN1500_c0_g2_i1.p1 TRINITY_DN1500_c0_g2~~TRINITY_DN1500_c0_g2_i1.p1  ORF type:complete len:2429 (-),score=434.34 TRINITY_DN1500_c0_g2_i1:360-7646(-)
MAEVKPVWDATPKKQGLYDPSNEGDACGVGAVVDMGRKASRKVVTDAGEMVIRMAHRGAEQANKGDGDGVGIMLSVPDGLFRSACSFELPPVGEYGAGNVFLPRQVDRRDDCLRLVRRMAGKFGLQVLGWRAPLPTNSSVLGPYASATEPFIGQVFLAAKSCDDNSRRLTSASPERGARRAPSSRRRGREDLDATEVEPGVSEDIKDLPFETKLFLVRRAIALRARELFVCSLSSRTIVYKGQFKPDQLFEYYVDLKNSLCCSYLAIVHSRFSTNSFPSWTRAHPFRRIAHNGEINTLEGNRNQMRSREANMQRAAGFGSLQLQTVFPIDEDIGSDSAMLDNVVELLAAAGNRDIAECIMMVIPEAWQNAAETMSKEKRAFYKYNSCLMEPWDGPALVAFTDGIQFGATLDRNGLRPGRFYITKDNMLVLASEVGVVDVEPQNVQFKGRLRPGKMLLVDFREGRLIEDDELKAKYASRLPYDEYLKANALEVAKLLPRETPDEMQLIEELLDENLSITSKDDPVIQQHLLPLLRLHGFTYEKMDMLISPMARAGHEPLGSMGQDMPLACLSQLPRQAFDYFVQLFAQATNPAIDPIREANVMSLLCPIGPERSLLESGPKSCSRIFLDEPVLCPQRFNLLCELAAFEHSVLDISYTLNEQSRARRADRTITGRSPLKERLHHICKEAEAAITGDQASILVLSHRRAGPDRVPVNSLLAVGALHQHLIAVKLRTKVAIVVEAADAFEVHHHCLLLGFGADAIYPYLCYLSLLRVRGTEAPLQTRIANYRDAAHFGILKVMSKMGISCLQSYKGAQLFQSIGVGKEVMDTCFAGCKNVLQGVGFDVFAVDALRFHKAAYPNRQLPPLVDNDVEELEDQGEYHFRAINNTEMHTNTPDIIFKLQEAARSNSKEAYKLFSEWQDKITEETEIRGQLEFCFDEIVPVPLEEVEPATEIVKRICTGAASFGSISSEAHRAMAIAMNRSGGRSNTGEGGEQPSRFTPLKAGMQKAGAVDWEMFDGDSERSKIKQVASGRFGVTAEYLANADEIQIKLAQGAKPGEGGELPGHKVIGDIAQTRLSTPGVGLISPPPHHDMYSIEDVAQLISDLKNANPSARISVKLVARIGIGVIASGIVKAKADHLTISGYSGGTGAAKWTSIKHAGMPWEIGVAETHQTLVLNGLRDRVTLQTDGQIRTGRDIVVSAMLGAEEVAMSTAPLIVLGCIMMRKCHLNTCPVGVATQDPELRKKFTGQPEHLINYFFMLAEEVREIMASLGIRKYTELVGRTDLLRPKAHLAETPKTASLDFGDLLRPAWTMESLMVDTSAGRGSISMHCCMAQDHRLAHVLDRQLVLRAAPALDTKRRIALKGQIIKNVDRSVGGILSFEVTRRYGGKGLPDGTVTVSFVGNAGQSFGNFLVPGITFFLEGDANDYIGKGLSGGRLVVFPPCSASFDAGHNVIAGNAALYGATAGRSFMAGIAAERFAVRNSGAIAVVEGVGDHGCEYMTRGLVVVLGPVGDNFAAGMSGGLAYVLDLQHEKCNTQTVFLEKLNQADRQSVLEVVQEHAETTGSKQAEALLADWDKAVLRFTKVFPKEYKKVVTDALLDNLKSKSDVSGRILDDFASIQNPIPERRDDQFLPHPGSGAHQEGMTRKERLCLFYGGLKANQDSPAQEFLASQQLLDELNVGNWWLPEANLGSSNYMENIRRGYAFWHGLVRARKDRLASSHRVLEKSWDAEEELRSKYPRAWQMLNEHANGVTPEDSKTHKVSQRSASTSSGSGDHMPDLEDMAKAPARPSSVAYPVKRRGFHEYDRKAMSYRDSKDRTLDWEEIYALQTKKSKQWHNWMHTQTARCMDCGTPTCHYPNQGGGGCPLGNRIPTWNQLVHEGEWKRALERLLDTNNFPEFTGTTCPAPCEEACVLGINEKPVAIKSTELAIVEYAFSKGWIQPQPPQQRTGRRVAIIGSGPAGMACAQQLNRAGHLVVVVERADRPGGLLMYGIPSMKLDKVDKVLRRTQILEREGIEFKLNTEVGRDISISDLCQQNDAVIVASGATQWRDLRNVDGRNLKNVVQAMEYLTATQKANLDADAGQKKVAAQTALFDVQDRHVIVIGGGDTAVDCVGTALRMGAKSVLQFSRRALAATERPEHTPWPCWADTFRVDYAHAEAVALHGKDPREYLVVTKKFLPAADDPGRVGKVLAAKLTEDGREQPQLVEYKADLVVLAMGFTGPDHALDADGRMLPRDSNGNYDGLYGEYRVQGSPWKHVFACGDCRHGASLVVTAIAEGRDCAARVDEFLMGETVLPRTAPLKANPSFYQIPKVQTSGSVMQRRQRRIIPKVSEGFERGVVHVERHHSQDSLATAFAKNKGTTEPTHDAPASVPTTSQHKGTADPVVPLTQVASLEDNSKVLWLSVGLAGLCMVNLALAAALLRSKK